MERWLNIQENLNEILFEVMQIENQAFVEEAKNVYELGIEKTVEGLFFTQFLSFHYLDESDKTLFSRYIEKHPESSLSMVTGLRFSVYEVKNYPAGKGLKDLYTKQDFLIKGEEELSEGDIIVAMLVSIGNDHFINEDYMLFPSQYKDPFIKGIMEKYNELCRSKGAMDLEHFVKNHPLIIMKFVEILNNVEQDAYEAVEDYLVYQTIFLVGDMKAAKEKVKNDPDFEVTLDESGFLVTRLFMDKGTDEENLIAEIVIDGNRIEIEALDEFRQNMAKAKIETLLQDLAVHFKDEVVSMDDLF